MEHSSIQMPTTLDHNDKKGRGEREMRVSLVGEKGEAGEVYQGKAKKEQGKAKKEQRSVFDALRGKASELKASALRVSIRKTSAESKVGRKSVTVATTRTKTGTLSKAVGTTKKVDKQRDESLEGSSRSSVPFVRGDYLVHPAHGVGYVRGVEAEEVAGARMDMIAISFEQERMVVRVPTCQCETCGLRSVSSKEAMEGIYDTLKIRRRIRKTMWGRRAQEYDNKIRSGDPVRLAQVIRELYRGEEQPSPSYSERQYYQLALERLSREVAVVEKIEEHLAVEKLETILAAA